MTKIGICSDLHGTVPKEIYTFFKDCDTIICAGDIGGESVLEELCLFKPVIAVVGNIDGWELLHKLKKTEIFHIEQCKILLTHIGGYPKHYAQSIYPLLATEKPDIFIAGHSHILKIIYDKELNLLHINPGAAGKYGIHTVSTLVRLEINGKIPQNLEILEFEK